MRERPILFSGPMVRALLDGTKTQTRRIVKPQPADYVQTTPDVHPTTRTAPYIDAYCGERKTTANPRGMSREWHWWTADNRLGAPVARCPYGQPGDRLWVREKARCYYSSETPPKNVGTIGVEYAAGGSKMQPYTLCRRGDYPWFPRLSRTLNGTTRWAPSIHMPRWASRITLEIVSVRVERLQDISGADAIAEGVFGPHIDKSWHGNPDYAKGAYTTLWESINGPGSWGANPWVWAVEFKRIEKVEST